MLWVNDNVDPLMNYYIALVAMYATAMFGMVILVGLSGQVSLGNGALMAVGGYVFALTTLNWETVPILGVPMNGLWAMGFAAVGGVVFGLLIGVLGARLRGPYLAGLTLGIAVGLPAIANRFPELLGGETGLQLTFPYPDGGYAPVDEALDEQFVEELPTEQEALPSEQASPGAEDLLTLDNFPSEGASAEASVAPEDLLTVENFPSGEASVAPDDLLTVDNFPSAEASARAGGPGRRRRRRHAASTASTSGFIIERWQATLAVAVACIVGFVALNLVRGRQGRVWRAVRDDPVAAAVSGISPAKSKVYAFTVSSLFAALSGAVFAQILAYVGPGGLRARAVPVAARRHRARGSLVAAGGADRRGAARVAAGVRPLAVQRPRLGGAGHQQRAQPHLRPAGRAGRAGRARGHRRHRASACGQGVPQGRA